MYDKNEKYRFFGFLGNSITLFSNVKDMQNSYSSPNRFPRESPAYVYEVIAIKFFIPSGFKNNCTFRVTQMFINRNGQKNCGTLIEWDVIQQWDWM